MMADPKVIIVVLRQQGNAKDKRSDPFWEFGSFGCTGCHKKNLMNPSKIGSLNGTRLAFAQGGDGGFKLILLTDPIQTISHGDFAEAKWPRSNRAFKYKKAPLLIADNKNSEFPLLRDFIASANCRSWQQKFASKFRSRRTPVDIDIAEEIIKVFNQYVVSNNPDLFISTYIDALPDFQGKIDNNRQQTYLELQRKAKHEDSFT